ncbi:hypothetical protein [Streptomyces longisporus]|uniref:Uncharacterized protein n=1 Tax=Streptomyces longisporus TaxID=1948 RepID=A0ABN3LH20_STRLO
MDGLQLQWALAPETYDMTGRLSSYLDRLLCSLNSRGWRSRMPSVVGLLEQHELAAHRGVDELREDADRVQAELDTVEQEWPRDNAELAPDDSQHSRTGERHNHMAL